jgi:hypothetical protein
MFSKPDSLADVSVMSPEARKCNLYAQECTRLAAKANTIEKRDSLLVLARVWRDAANTEEQALGAQTRTTLMRAGA